MRQKLFITVSFRWWVFPYLNTLVLFALTFGVEPNLEKVGRFVCRYGMKVS